MAKTYIGYAQREAETNVNWGAVATQFTDMLTEQQKLKEENSAADALVTQDLATQLQNAPEGGDQESSDYILDYVNNASNYNLMLKRNLDNGNMSRKQFTKLSQNLSNGTAQIIAISKKYNSYLEEQQKRLEEDKLSGKDGWAAGKVQSFNDFRNTAAFIDPVTMKVSNGKLVKKTVDGKTVRSLSTNTADFQQVSTMLGWMGQKTDKFDVNAAIESSYKMLAPSFQTNYLDGSVKDDVRKNPGFQKATKKQLMSYLSTPDNVGSILYDFARMAPDGTPWEFSDDEKKAKNENSIYMKPDDSGVYNIDLESKQGKYLQDEAYKVLAAQLDLRIPRKVVKTANVPTAGKPPTPEDIGSLNNVRAMLQVAYGNKDERAAGTSQILAGNSNYRSVKPNRDNTGIVIVEKTDNGDVSFTIPFNSNPNMLLQSAGKVIGTDVSYNRALSLLKQDDETTFNNLYRSKLNNTDDVLMEGFDTIDTIDNEGAYNTLEINTGKTKEVENADGRKTIVPITETPVQLFTDALGKSTFGYDEELTKMVPVMEQIFKNSKIGSLVDDMNVFVLIDDDDTNKSGKELNDYIEARGSISPNLLKIYLPNVMNGPIYVHQENDKAKNVSRINQITRTIYDAANEGRKLSPNDFGFMQNKYDRELNKGAYEYESKNDSFVLPGSKVKFQWNGGDGSKNENSQIRNTSSLYTKIRVNGKIVTVDENNNIVEEVVVKTPTVDVAGKWDRFNKPTDIKD